MAPESRALFDLLISRVRQIAEDRSEPAHVAFVRWFAHMYHLKPLEFRSSDGPGDGKVDAFYFTYEAGAVHRHLVNAKYTASYGRLAPPTFYEELTRLSTAFRARTKRGDWLERAVKPELHHAYKQLFDAYDEGRARITFLTTHRANENALTAQALDRFDFFHLDELLAFVADDAESAMPRTPNLELTEVRSGAILSTDPDETGGVPTAVVFARLIDFIDYMKADPADLLFARNVRLDLGRRRKLPRGSPLRVNEEIRETFRLYPEEFAYSNNGVTLLCEDWKVDAGQRLVIVNPRVVNGSQTLHSIREVRRPSSAARVLVRVVKVPAIDGSQSATALRERRELIANISTRSNRQNPIKKWNLVANDDYQTEVARVFRRRQLFYQRRVGDWKKQRLDLKEAGVREGPLVTTLMQILASARWNDPDLGPANAKNRLDALFNEAAYRKMTARPPTDAVTLYVLYSRLDSALAARARRTAWVDRMRRHARLAMFAVLMRLLEERRLTSLQLARLADAPESDVDWDALAYALAAFVRRTWEHAKPVYKRSEGVDLTINNFVKSGVHVRRLTHGAIPQPVRTSVTGLLSSSGRR